MIGNRVAKDRDFPNENSAEMDHLDCPGSFDHAFESHCLTNIGQCSDFESKLARNRIMIQINGHARDTAHMTVLTAMSATMKLSAPRNQTRTIMLPVKIEKPESE